MSKLLRHDLRQLAKSPGIVGIDEVGRGALAGPVAAAAVWFDRRFLDDKGRRRFFKKINDSKKLSSERREEVAAQINAWRDAGILRCAVAGASVMEIDAYNILGATRLAIQRCIQNLVETHNGTCPFAAATGNDLPLFGGNATDWPAILVDGKPLKPFAWVHTAIVGGDAKSLAIAMASNLAKVYRDGLMRKLADEFPKYNFEKNKGYGTHEHIAAIARFGACAHHRPLFLRKVLEGNLLKNDTQIEFDFA